MIALIIPFVAFPFKLESPFAPAKIINIPLTMNARVTIVPINMVAANMKSCTKESTEVLDSLLSPPDLSPSIPYTSIVHPAQSIQLAVGLIASLGSSSGPIGSAQPFPSSLDSVGPSHLVGASAKTNMGAQQMDSITRKDKIFFIVGRVENKRDRSQIFKYALGKFRKYLIKD